MKAYSNFYFICYHSFKFTLYTDYFYFEFCGKVSFNVEELSLEILHK